MYKTGMNATLLGVVMTALLTAVSCSGFNNQCQPYSCGYPNQCLHSPRIETPNNCGTCKRWYYNSSSQTCKTIWPKGCIVGCNGFDGYHDCINACGNLQGK
uniref:BPTI/Kunitz inhibitor domain-containing protein n=1 Tax=Rhipicephalus zambeziensis TaxID=60191 RepID=A0A224YGP3_9ACAR